MTTTMTTEENILPPTFSVNRTRDFYLQIRFPLIFNILQAKIPRSIQK